MAEVCRQWVCGCGGVRVRGFCSEDERRGIARSRCYGIAVERVCMLERLSQTPTQSRRSFEVLARVVEAERRCDVRGPMMCLNAPGAEGEGGGRGVGVGHTLLGAAIASGGRILRDGLVDWRVCCRRCRGCVHVILSRSLRSWLVRVRAFIRPTRHTASDTSHHTTAS